MKLCERTVIRNQLLNLCFKLPIKLFLNRYTIIGMIVLTILGGLFHGVSSVYNYTKYRKVSLGQVRLSENLPIGKHWGVRVDHKFWKPYWMEIDGKTSFFQMYATTNIISSEGGTSIRGAEPTDYMGLTNKTDSEIYEFNDAWKKEHPNYRLTSDNCQRYAADLIVFLCGPEAAESLPWQEGPVVQTLTYSSLLTITLFYVIVAVFLSRREKKE